jgi:hypothetical protein
MRTSRRATRRRTALALAKQNEPEYETRMDRERKTLPRGITASLAKARMVPAMETGAATARTARTRVVAARRNPRTNPADEPHGTLSRAMRTLLTSRADDTITPRTTATRTKASPTAEDKTATVNAVV